MIGFPRTCPGQGSTHRLVRAPLGFSDLIGDRLWCVNPWIQSDLFESCHQIVDPVKYYERCVHDSCGCDRGGDCECLCTAIAAYGTACSQSGVSVRWRSQEHCPMQCDNGKVYKSCGDPCEPSCRYLNQPRSQHCSIISCVEGCFCEEGFIEHEGNGCPRVLI